MLADRAEIEQFLYKEARLLDSRRAIAARVGACRTLAYPFGDWNSRVAAAARDAGYDYAFTMPRSGQLRGYFQLRLGRARRARVTLRPCSRIDCRSRLLQIPA